MDAETLWPLTRIAFDLPEKPLFGDACNRCGLCCLMEQCSISLAFFGNRGICPALNLQGGASTCELISEPQKHVPAVIAAEVGELSALTLGSGTGCDATATDADQEVYERQGMGQPPRSELDRAERLWDAVFTKLRASLA